MWLLILAISAVLAGVLLLPLVRRRGAWLGGLDGFVAVFVGGIVALHILPEAIEHGGTAAVIAAALGLAAPLGMHWAMRRGRCTGVRSRRLRWTLISIAALAVACHAAVDGMALASVAGGDHHGEHAMHAGGQALAVAVIAHRVPTGLSLGWIVERVARLRGALLAAVGVGLATVLGFVLGRAGLVGHGAAVLAVLQAAVAGTLLHVVTGHATPHRAPARTDRVATLVGGVAACGLLAVMSVVDAALVPLALLALVPLAARARRTSATSSDAPMPALSAVAAAVGSDVD